MKTPNTLIISILIMFLISCKKQAEISINQEPIIQNEVENQDNNSLSYTITKIESYENDYKAQLKVYAFINSDSISDNKIRNTLKVILSNSRSEGEFKNYLAPTNIGVYLYTSEEKSKLMDSDWIAMLMKVQSETEPSITINEMKLKGLTNLQDNEKTNDEIMLEKLEQYFKERNTDLCSLYKKLNQLESESIKQADKKYPDFGDDNLNYSTKWYENEKSKFFSKNKINDSLTTYILVFGSTYCK